MRITLILARRVFAIAAFSKQKLRGFIATITSILDENRRRLKTSWDAGRERPLLDSRCLPTNPRENEMATKPNDQDDTAQSTGNDQSGEGTFETDVSETDDEGTTVRQAEVKEDDLSEVKKDNS
ncbi:hypothetical protein PQQ84_11310 [Paraburkholderia strydomiana]|jgi:hypothetical protein|uniref:hypothetical protein n=1 Tax=Paraburkholderia strydomiana TaxID=1245417 RepID=UPI0038BBDCD4